MLSGWIWICRLNAIIIQARRGSKDPTIASVRPKVGNSKSLEISESRDSWSRGSRWKIGIRGSAFRLAIIDPSAVRDHVGRFEGSSTFICKTKKKEKKRKNEISVVINTSRLLIVTRLSTPLRIADALIIDASSRRARNPGRHFFLFLLTIMTDAERDKYTRLNSLIQFCC